jgi:glycosyltransferase involved in cell wall biosynthesis
MSNIITPVVSIIVVTYNAAGVLPNCLNSILAQTYKDYEIVLIDGGSQDGTIDIINTYNEKIGYWVSEKDEGIYDAMNKGIRASRGEWILFLGADDVLYSENVLQEVFKNKSFENISFLYGEIKLKSSGKIYGGSRTYSQLVENNISHQAIFYRKDLLEQFGYFNTRYKVLADYDMNLRIFRDDTIGKTFVSVIITLFNDKGTSNMVIDKHFFYDQLQYFSHSGEYMESSPELQKYFFFTGFSAILQKQWRLGIKDLKKSLFRGNRKLYYLLVAGKFFLSMAGIGKKISTS